MTDTVVAYFIPFSGILTYMYMVSCVILDSMGIYVNGDVMWSHYRKIASILLA